MAARFTRISLVLGVRRITLMVLLGCLPTACRTWQVEPVPVAMALPVARVSLVDGSQVMLRNALVLSDSLIGRRTSDPSLRVAIPLAAVHSVEVEKISVERSVGWGILTCVVTGASVILWFLLHVPGD